jgi:uncharacterized protein (DUF1330 family)
MPVYVIAEVDVTDPEGMAKEFTAKNQPIVRAAGGRYLAAGGKTLALEGEPPKRVVIHVWDSMDEVKAWWNSPELRENRKIGDKYGKFRVFAVEGLPQ